MSVPAEQGRLARTVTLIERAWKLLAALTGIGAFLTAAWLHFIGPGILSWTQEALGITQLRAQQEMIIRALPAPPVVEWNMAASQQQGRCDSTSCNYILTGARTVYGESCGRPVETVPFLQLDNGRVIQLDYEDGFEPVELDRTPRSFSVPLDVPDFAPPGAHSWRTRVRYPACPGFNEPIPRWTPYFPLVIE